MGSRAAGWVVAALLALPASSYAQAAPVNDNYLESLQLNAPGERLERTLTLQAAGDTTNTTVRATCSVHRRAAAPPS